MDQIRRLVHEIHRRSLWQVIGIYCVGSWLGYQVILGVTDGLSLPDWVPPLAFVLFVIGLPIVVATAFVNEGPPALRPRDPTLLPELETTPAFDDAGPVAGPAKQPALTWKRAIGAGAAAFLLLGLTAGGYSGLRLAGIGPMGSLIAKGALAEHDALLLADFGGAAEDSLLTAALTEALRIDLGQSRTLVLVQPRVVRAALERMQRDPAAHLDEALAREIAMRESIRAVLAGDVRRLAGSWVITARVITAAEGDELAAFRETARDSTQLLAAMDRLSRKLRARVGESLRDVRASEPLESVTTPSLEALRRYSQARRLLEARRDHQRGLRLLEEAIAIDTSFAMAYRQLAVELRNDERSRARMLDAAQRAYRFSERLTELERLHATLFYELMVRGDIDAALAAGEQLIERYPNDFAAVNNVGLLHGRRRNYARAEELYRRTAQLDPNVAIGLTNHAVALMHLGRYDEADSVLAVYARRFPEGAPDLWHAALLGSRGDYEAAFAAATQRLDELPAGQQQLWGYRGAFRAALVLGRLREAETFADRLRRFHHEENDPQLYLRETINLVRADVRLRNRPPARALLRLDSALARWPLDHAAPLDRPYPQLAALYAELGEPQTARALLDEYEAVVEADVRRAVAFDELDARGRIAMAEQRWSDAVRDFHAAIELDECMRCYLEALSHAFEQAGMRDSAIAYARRYVDMPQAFRFEQDAFDLVLVLERLGRLYEEQGDRARAAQTWARITELWKDADAELHARVREAQQRVRVLTGA